MPIKVEKRLEEFGGHRYVYLVCYRYSDDPHHVYNAFIPLSEYNRLLTSDKMPIMLSSYEPIWLDKDDFITTKEEWEQNHLRKILFSAQKIKTIRKLLYIPEIYGNVYYERKSDFISLIHKM